MPNLPQATIDFGSSASSFEETLPAWSQRDEELPLHYMGTEDKARRRVVRAVGPGGDSDGPSGNGLRADLDYDESKELSTKSRASAALRKAMPMPRYRQAPSTFREDLIEHLPAAIYTLLSCYTRFHAIGKAPIVVWDEAHFGGFGSRYLKREFYFDVHPPLGKMIVGLVGLLSGYDGLFEFKSGSEYEDKVPYVAMRVLLATFGVLMVPLGWYTARELGMSIRATHLVTIMVLCDMAWLTISRFILLDSMLIFFTFATVFGLTKIHSHRFESFSIDWWLWMIYTGLSIGCVISVKWIGFFVTALVGLYTIEDLWEKFGETRMPFRTYAKHWVARGLCLIILPLLVYMASFKLHFLILNHSGPGDAQMSSLFQANLIGNDFAQNPLEIAYGSKLTLKNMGWGGGLLHSHVQTFPTGSQQQQVTCYHYKDDNNNWVISPLWSEPALDINGEIRYLVDGDRLRIVHAPTNRNLHSHVMPAPVTKLHNEVSGYGNATVGDQNDHWIVEVVDDLRRGRNLRAKAEKEGKGVRIHSLTTRLRFRHATLGCYLRAANAILPPWGFKQVEVTCDKEDNKKDAHTYWNVESHWNDRLPPGDTKFYKSPFFRDFWHLNVAMMTSNNALIPDPDKEDILASAPFDWPWLRVGLRMCGWGDEQVKYYLLGNPIIWWGGGASLLVAIATVSIYLIRMQRRYVDWEAGEWDQFLYVTKVAFIGWCLHYLPFMIMGRVTYLHHYLPTLYFAVLMLAHLMDHFVFQSRRLSEQVKWGVFGAFAGAVIGTFLWFKGVSFGLEGPILSHTGMEWRKSWNIYHEHAA